MLACHSAGLALPLMALIFASPPRPANKRTRSSSPLASRSSASMRSATRKPLAATRCDPRSNAMPSSASWRSVARGLVSSPAASIRAGDAERVHRTAAVASANSAPSSATGPAFASSTLSLPETTVDAPMRAALTEACCVAESKSMPPSEIAPNFVSNAFSPVLASARSRRPSFAPFRVKRGLPCSSAKR